MLLDILDLHFIFSTTFNVERYGRKLRPWSRDISEGQKGNKHRHQEITKTTTKNIGSSIEYIKDPFVTTKLISSSNEYIKDGKERLDTFPPSSAIKSRVDTNPSNYYTSDEERKDITAPNTSNFSPPSKIYFGFKPVLQR